MDIVDPNCQDIVLISEDYCLDKSFDIIQKNFEVLTTKLENKQKEVDLYKILREKYSKNKQKYEKFLTFVNQFSGNLLDVYYVFEKYRNIWSIINTPMEIVYPSIISLNNWGEFDKKNGILTKTLASQNTQKEILEWTNYKFEYSLYGLYEFLNVRVYIDTSLPFNFSLNAEYDELCLANGGTKTVCCRGCGFGSDNKGCNRMGPKGTHVCGNMYDYCPSGNHSTNCATGQCTGSGNKKLQINKTITLPNDTYLLGSNVLKLKVNKNTKLWEII